MIQTTTTIDNTTTITAAVPALPALDLDRAIGFYGRVLGFAEAFRTDDYAGLRREGAEIHLWRCENRMIPENTSCYLLVRTIEPLYRACAERLPVRGSSSAAIIEELATQPWGLREFALLDSEGNLVRVRELAG